MEHIQHILRLARLLAVVAVAAILARSARLPPTFGQYGPYVGASVELIRGKPVQYAGSEACKSCHKREWSKWSRKEHAAVGCETCHGPGAAHAVEEADPRPPMLRSTADGSMAAQAHHLCMSCHAQVPGRPGPFPQIQLAEHLAGFGVTETSPDYQESKECLSCHPGHSPIR